MEPVIPDQQEPLIAKPELNCAQYTGRAALTTLQLSLAVTGTFVILFYIDPAQTCADAPNCGQWFSKIVTREVAIAFFTAGGLGFVSTNSYFSYQSLKAYYEYLKNEPNVLLKTAKGVFVAGFTAMQTYPALLNSLQTASAPWVTFLSVAGTIPGALFGSVSFAEHQLASAIVKTKSLVNGVLYHAAEKMGHPHSVAEMEARNKREHYAKQFPIFKKQVQANWDELVQSINNMERVYDPLANANPLDLLFAVNAPIPNKTAGSYAMDALNYSASAAMSVAMGSPFWMPTSNQFLKLNFSFYEAQVLTFLFSISGIIGNLTFLSKAFHSLSDTASNLVQGKSIPCVEYQLRPKLTSAAYLVCILLATLSYCYVDTLFQKVFPGEDAGFKKGARIAADVSIDLYHLAGFFQVFQLFFKLSTRNKVDQLFFAVRDEKDRLLGMSLDDFIKFVEDPKNTLNHGVEKYTTASSQIDIDALPDVSKQEVVTPLAKQSLFKACCPVKPENVSHQPSACIIV